MVSRPVRRSRLEVHGRLLMAPTQSRIPLVDLAAQYRALKPEIDAAIQRVVSRGQFILGPEVEALEQEVAAFCGARHAVGVASGTDALSLTLRACGVGPGDEVITPVLSFVAAAEVIAALGARPVFVDVDPLSYTMDPAQAAAKISSKTKAILPVHLYGHPCAMEELVSLADRHHLALIEDCAQAMGARARGRRVGTFGTAGCFSFFPSKNLGAYGDGGMVVTDDDALAEQIRILRVHGSRRRYHHDVLGVNSRLDELQAAILRVKLPHLEAWNEARRQHAGTYRRLIGEQGLGGLRLPEERPGCQHAYHLYVIRSAQRDQLASALTQQGIGVQVTYPLALSLQPALAFLGHRPGDFPMAERATMEVLSLPMYPELTPPLLQQVVGELARALGVALSRS